MIPNSPQRPLERAGLLTIIYVEKNAHVGSVPFTTLASLKRQIKRSYNH